MNETPTHNQSEFIDQQRELSGAGGAKEQRFFDEGGTPRSRQEKERKARANARAFNRLMELMQDPAYAAAEFERDLIAARTKEGLAAARRRGVRLGRPRVLDEDACKHALFLIGNGVRVEVAADQFGIGRSTLYRYLSGTRNREAA